jgi:hypothetical protein
MRNGLTRKLAVIDKVWLGEMSGWWNGVAAWYMSEDFQNKNVNFADKNWNIFGQHYKPLIAVMGSNQL